MILKYHHILLLDFFLNRLEHNISLIYETHELYINDILNTLNISVDNKHILKQSEIFSVIIESLLLNSKINIEDNIKRSVSLLSITSFLIFLHNNNATQISKKDLKSLLEELRLSGLGDGLVKSFVMVIDNINSLIYNLTEDGKNLFSINDDMLYSIILSINDLIINKKISIDRFNKDFAASLGGITYLMNSNSFYLLKKDLEKKININPDISNLKEPLEYSKIILNEEN